MQRPPTRYVISRGADGTPVSIAWQQYGPTGEDAGHELVQVRGFTSHLDFEWEIPAAAALAERLARFARVTTFDKRGVGMSDRVAQPPTLEERIDDLLAVMDAGGVASATIMGISEGVPMAVMFAAAHPTRVRSLVLYGGMARTTEASGYPYAPSREALLESAGQLLLPHWDEPVLAEIFAPSIVDDPVEVGRWQRYQQVAATPGMVAQLSLMAMDLDVRDLLPLISVPTLVLHRRGDQAVSVHGARWMAKQIPDATYLEVEGNDHSAWYGDNVAMFDAVEEFVTGRVAQVEHERLLTTVLFTDIVDSTGRASAMGDAAWKSLLSKHDTLVDEAVARNRGEVRKHFGDGVMATFDGPARAARAGLAARAAVEAIGLQLRAGVHCGEVELVGGNDVTGIAVHVAARVQSVAEPGEVLASSTVVDLSSGCGLSFEDRGEHELKGVDRAWRLFSVHEPTG